jgi:hypothetical protein
MTSSAGADNILIEIYWFIKLFVSSEVLKKCSIKNTMGSLKKIIIKPINNAKIKFLIKTKIISLY